MDEFVKMAVPVPVLMREPDPPIGESMVVVTPGLVSKVPLELIVIVRVAGILKEAVVLRVPPPNVSPPALPPRFPSELIRRIPALMVVPPV